MKRLLLVLALCSQLHAQRILAPIMAGAPAAAAPSITIVQAVGLCNGSASTLTVTVGVNYNGNTLATPTAGNKLSAHVWYSSGVFSITGVADNAANAFAQVSGSPVSPAGSAAASHWTKSTTGSETSFTATANNSGAICLVIAEWHGLSSSPFDVLDTTANFSLSSSTWTTTAFTPTAGGRVAIGLCWGQGSVQCAGDTGWTLAGASVVSGATYATGIVYKVYTADGSTSITPQGKFAGAVSSAWFADGISLK